MKRIGTLHKTREGYIVKVVEYTNYDNIIVEIQDKYLHRVKTGWGNIIKGKVKNPYHKSVYNTGYFGVGKYKSRAKGVLTKEYKHWQSMLQRCYDEKFYQRQPSYMGCTVCSEWHNFQKFAEWCDENYYQIKDKKMCLDKDLIIKGNKTYSKDTCVFVPQEINLIFGNHTSVRGLFPIGVAFDSNRNKYVSTLRIGNRSIRLGYHADYMDAFHRYKSEKEIYIKTMAEKYKKDVPRIVYDSLMKWDIKIDD